MADGTSASYGLVLRFDSDDPEFTRGFECGYLWSEMERVTRIPDCFACNGIPATVHASNAEMVMRMCEAKGFTFTAEPLGDDWMAVTLKSPPMLW